jgi:hypothetical protein
MALLCSLWKHRFEEERKGRRNKRALSSIENFTRSFYPQSSSSDK